MAGADDGDGEEGNEVRDGSAQRESSSCRPLQTMGRSWAFCSNWRVSAEILRNLVLGFEAPSGYLLECRSVWRYCLPELQLPQALGRSCDLGTMRGPGSCHLSAPPLSPDLTVLSHGPTF